MDNKDESTLASQSQAAQPSDEQLRETDGYKLGWMEGMQEGAELATGGEKTAADVEAEFADLLPGSYYMDPPDGGSPSVLEQVSRMAEDAAQWRTHLAGQSQATKVQAVTKESALRALEYLEQSNSDGRKREAIAMLTAQEVTQQEAKAETAEQAVPQGWRVTAKQNQEGRFYIVSDGRSMRAVTEDNEPTLFRYFSDLAPTTSTVSAPEEVRNVALEEAAKLCDEMEEHYAAYKDTAQLNGDIELSIAASGEPRACRFLAEKIRALRTTSGKGEAA